MSGAPIITIDLDPEEEKPPVLPGVSYTIGGIPVTFPLKAYPSQVAIMSKVITGLQKAQNCLLESPTGSGKTLALLCSSLAWQVGEKEKARQLQFEWMQENAKKEQFKLQKVNEPPEIVSSEPCCKCSTTTPVLVPNTAVPKDATSPVDDDFSDDEDRQAFKPAKKKRKGNAKGVSFDSDEDKKPAASEVKPLAAEADASQLKTEAEGIKVETDGVKIENDGVKIETGGVKVETDGVTIVLDEKVKPANGACCCKNKENKPAQRAKKVYRGRGNRQQVDEEDEDEESDYPSMKIPKIFYGTRTHKQIEQVVRELGKTVYKNVRMSILGSREHTCIKQLGTYKSKTEMCHELLDPRQGIGCSYKSNVESTMGNHQLLKRYGCPEPWDIEDLVHLGQTLKSCPYFSARALMKGADLVFCPYNYLIDPQIQESMSLSLAGNVIIFDEAHNIEDIAREAASYTVDHEDIKKAADDCKIVAINGRLREVHSLLEDYLMKLYGWIVEQEDKLVNSSEEYDKSSYTWSGIDALASFENSYVGGTAFYHFKNAGLLAVNDLMSINPTDTNVLPMMTQLTKMLIQGLCQVLGNMYDNDMKHRQDYRVAILKQVNNRRRNTGADLTGNDGWVNMSGRRGGSPRSSLTDVSAWQRSLNFWCQNPAVAMKDVRESVRSIILTSGTLAPVDSFSSELGVLFPIQFEANHVITPAQVYVTSISHGPQNISLNAQWKNAETWNFQDELGRLVLDVCRTVPYGVLCFFPSYKLLEKLTTRWQATGMWNQLEECKRVLSEPRKAGDLDHVLMDFNMSIEESGEFRSENVSRNWATDGALRTGALLFAVHRGKISEGIDFADNQARAVIAVGIPYPNFKDVKVELKRKYNDDFSRSRGLLSGSRWYDIQAYRALNQALGRCIRHRNDWGAIILVDDRFAKGPYYTNGLSKWIRNLLRHNNSFQTMTAGLRGFVESRLTIMEAEQQE